MRKLEFSEWMKQVDIELVRRCGMPSSCLPDYCYRDCYDAGDSAKETAAEAIEYAKDC